MPKKLLSDTIKEYRENYNMRAGRYPIVIPLTKTEMENMVFEIRKFVIENPDKDSFYVEENDSDLLLVWRGAELMENDEAERLRASIMP